MRSGKIFSEVFEITDQDLCAIMQTARVSILIPPCPHREEKEVPKKRVGDQSIAGLS
jgi:hypothetical protein